MVLPEENSVFLPVFAPGQVVSPEENWVFLPVFALVRWFEIRPDSKPYFPAALEEGCKNCGLECVVVSVCARYHLLFCYSVVMRFVVVVATLSK